MAENREIELKQQYAVISIPVNTVELKICAKIYLFKSCPRFEDYIA